MSKTINYTKGDIVFVVEPTNTIIGEVTGKVKENVFEIEPLYFKRKVNTTSIWTRPEYVKAILGDSKEKALSEYAEYFV